MKALIVTLLTTGLLQFANLASGMLAAHLLMPAGRGELAAAILWPTTIAYLVLFGLHDSALYHAAGKRETPKDLFGASLVLGVIATVIGMAAGYFIVIPLAYSGNLAPVAPIAVFLLLLIPCNVLGSIFQEMLRGHQWLGVWNALRVLLAVGYVLFITIFYALGKADVQSFAIAYLLSQAPPLIIALAIGIRAGWGQWKAPGATIKRVAIYGGKIHSSNVVTMINSRIDQLLIAATLAPSALGLYVAATTLSQITATLSNSISLVAYPRACAVPTNEERARIIGVYLRATAALMISSTLVLWIAAPLLLHILFGQSFIEAAPIVRILVLGVIPFALKDFFVLAFKAFDKALSISEAETVALVLNAGLLWLLVRPFGLTGAAASFVIMRWLSFFYFGWLVKRDLKLKLTELFKPTRADLELALSVMTRIRHFLERYKPARRVT